MSKRIVLVGLLILIIFLVSTKYPFYPSQFVTNKTFVKVSNLFYTYEITRYPTDVNLTKAIPLEQLKNIGVVTDVWNLKFGRIPTGGNYSIRRFVTVKNNLDKSVTIEGKAYGNISKLIVFPQNNLLLAPKQQTNFTVKLTPTLQIKKGYYAGEIDIIVKIPKFGFGFDWG